MHAVEILVPNDARRMQSATTLRQNDAELKADDLCKDFPSRIQKLIGKEGDRLKE